nr:DNA methyltransferase [Mycobacteroides chelonae]
MRIQNDVTGGLFELLKAAFDVVAAVARPGAPVYVAHADTERTTFESAMDSAGLQVRQNLVWVKNMMALGRSDYQYRHEPILYGFAPGGGGRLGRGGERWFGDNKSTTVFEVDKPARNAQHPTMKPVALIDAMLANSLPQGGVVLDPFAGSGSTLIAAHGRQSRCFGVELDPRYADVILQRFEEHTGIVPALDGEPAVYETVIGLGGAITDAAVPDVSTVALGIVLASVTLNRNTALKAVAYVDANLGRNPATTRSPECCEGWQG